MSHPFSTIPAGKLRQWFIPMLILTLVMMVLMNWIGIPLETEAAPLGIISYELAGDTVTASGIIASWEQPARIRAAFSLGVDYLFLVVYSTTISLACIWAARVLTGEGWRLADIGVWLAWGLWLAAILDGLENTALVALLFGSTAQYWALIARWCALFKFAIIFTGLTYAFLGAAVVLARRARRRS